jgi:hypothetical protein
MSDFDQIFDIVVRSEGGFTDNPADPGNWTGGRVGAGACRGTKFGISARAHPELDIAGLTLDQARSLYRREYWDRINGDRSTTASATPYVGCSRSPRSLRMALSGRKRCRRSASWSRSRMAARSCASNCWLSA